MTSTMHYDAIITGHEKFGQVVEVATEERDHE